MLCLRAAADCSAARGCTQGLLSHRHWNLSCSEHFLGQPPQKPRALCSRWVARVSAGGLSASWDRAQVCAKHRCRAAQQVDFIEFAQSVVSLFASLCRRKSWKYATLPCALSLLIPDCDTHAAQRAVTNARTRSPRACIEGARDSACLAKERESNREGLSPSCVGAAIVPASFPP
jgi:hypothetical protein